jgi:hypothetical protein
MEGLVQIFYAGMKLEKIWTIFVAAGLSNFAGNNVGKTDQNPKDCYM